MTTGKRCGVWRKMKTIEEMKSFPAARKITDRKGRKTVGRTDEMVPGCEVWHVYSLGSIFDARKGEWVLMNEHLDVRKYETLKDDFLAENFDAEQWAKMQRQRG